MKSYNCLIDFYQDVFEKYLHTLDPEEVFIDTEKYKNGDIVEVDYCFMEDDNFSEREIWEDDDEFKGVGVNEPVITMLTYKDLIGIFPFYVPYKYGPEYFKVKAYYKYESGLLTFERLEDES